MRTQRRLRFCRSRTRGGATGVRFAFAAAAMTLNDLTAATGRDAHPITPQQPDCRTLRPPGPLVETCARIGFVMRGVMYVAIGIIAALTAAGWARHVAGSTGALAAIFQQRFGRLSLGLVAAGLAGFGVWCLARALSRRPHATTRWRSIFSRADFFIGFVIHVALVTVCVHLFRGRGEADVTGDASVRSWVLELMSYPLGRLVVALLGAYLVGNGLQQVFWGMTTDLAALLELDALAAPARRSIRTISRAGIAARGAVLGMVGAFLLLAAYYADASHAHGIGGALEELARSAGPGLLAIVAAGLIAYGVYEFVRARYRRVQTM